MSNNDDKHPKKPSATTSEVNTPPDTRIKASVVVEADASSAKANSFYAGGDQEVKAGSVYKATSGMDSRINANNLSAGIGLTKTLSADKAEGSIGIGLKISGQTSTVSAINQSLPQTMTETTVDIPDAIHIRQKTLTAADFSKPLPTPAPNAPSTTLANAHFTGAVGELTGILNKGNHKESILTAGIKYGKGQVASVLDTKDIRDFANAVGFNPSPETSRRTEPGTLQGISAKLGEGKYRPGLELDYQSITSKGSGNDSNNGTHWNQTKWSLSKTVYLGHSVDAASLKLKAGVVITDVSILHEMPANGPSTPITYSLGGAEGHGLNPNASITLTVPIGRGRK